MIKYNQDPDVVRWGLHHLFDICTISNSGSQSTVTRYDRDSSQVGYVVEGYCDRPEPDLESDEVIAHVLQEELSKVAAAESSGSANPVQESIVTQDWHASSRRVLNYGMKLPIVSALNFFFFHYNSYNVRALCCRG